MTNTSQSYKELGTPYFKEVFELLDETFRTRKIPYYLIGATAISLELLKEGIKPSRGTKDIDFAIMISSKTDYEKLTESIQEKGFVKIAAPWTFRHPHYDIVVDMLPFGEIEENHTDNFDRRNIDLHVLGFKEVLSETTLVAIEETIVNIPTLPGMIILKLVAWSDRPEERENALNDILKIISESYWLLEDSIIDFHPDLLEFLGEDGEISQRIVASRVLGRGVAKFLQLSIPLKERILLVIEKNINDQYHSAIAKDWAAKLNQPIDHALSLLESFLAGIKERL